MNHEDRPIGDEFDYEEELERYGNSWYWGGEEVFAAIHDATDQEVVFGVSQKNTEEPAKEIGAFEDAVGAAAFAEGAESENTMVDE